MSEIYYKPHPDDVYFLFQLGIENVRETMAHGEWNPLGVVHCDEGGSVRLEVNLMPVPFWRATITRDADAPGTMETVTLRTGSGRLATYWPTFQMLAENMLAVATPGGAG